MEAHEGAITAPSGPERAAARFGYWAALGTGLMTLVTFGVAFATPPRSGRLCQEGCFQYPYLDIASRFPRDYHWMVPAILATLFYVAFVIGLHARATPEKRLVAQLGVVLSTMAALTIVGNYYVQLSVIQPSLLAGEADGISVLSQYNQHGVFIVLEELGFLLMSLSLACMAQGLSASSRLERAVRRLFVGGLAVNALGLAWFLVRHGHDRGYLFELLVISVDWLVLIVGAFLMAAVFRHAGQSGSR